MTIETAGGIKSLLLYTRNGKANTISVGMGKADLDAMSLPTTLPGSTIINRPVEIAGGTYHITCASVGNPHCVVFCDDPSALDLETLGPKFERASYFPERINTEFVRIVNEDTPADAGLRTGQWGRPWPAAPAPAPLSLPPQRMALWRKAKISQSS